MDILEDYFRAFHGQFIDNLGYSFLITRDWVGTEDNGIVRFDHNLLMDIRCHT